MTDRLNLITAIETAKKHATKYEKDYIIVPFKETDMILELLKKQESLLGFHQTADDITFISTGTAQEGEKRGIAFGKKLMHEWLYKDLLYNDLLTDEIRSVFRQAESI